MGGFDGGGRRAGNDNRARSGSSCKARGEEVRTDDVWLILQPGLAAGVRLRCVWLFNGTVLVAAYSFLVVLCLTFPGQQLSARDAAGASDVDWDGALLAFVRRPPRARARCRHCARGSLRRFVGALTIASTCRVRRPCVSHVGCGVCPAVCHRSRRSRSAHRHVRLATVHAVRGRDEPAHVCPLVPTRHHELAGGARVRELMHQNSDGDGRA
eukprot:7234932-Prymnesium_polylepis.1